MGVQELKWNSSQFSHQKVLSGADALKGDPD